MLVGAFQGRSWWPSRLIELATMSPYSHATFVFDVSAARIARELAEAGELLRMPCFGLGTCIEAWAGGVRCSPSISTLHTDRTRVDLFHPNPVLAEFAERNLIRWLDSQIGKPYDYREVANFLLRRAGSDEDGKWFCSKLVAGGFIEIARPLFRRTEAWRVSPGWLVRTNDLRPAGTDWTCREGLN